MGSEMLRWLAETREITSGDYSAALRSMPPLEHLRDYVHFEACSYARNLLYADEDFSLLLMCWRPGQHSPVHCHGEGKKSWVRVFAGSLLWTQYGEADEKGERSVSRCRLVGTGECIDEPDGSVFHHVQNINLSACAISVHIFSPSVIECSGTCGAVFPVTYVPLSGIKSPLGICPSSEVYMSFERLAAALEEKLEQEGPRDIDGIQKMLQAVRLNPKEYQRYAHWGENRYTRNLIGYNPRYTLLLLCWDKAQESPIHDHAGSSCFMKILEGSLHEVRYDASTPRLLQVKRITRMQKEDVAYIDDTQGVHKMVNPRADEGCMSLHVYIPPYTRCNVFNLCTGTKELVGYEKVFGDNPFDSIPLEPGHIVQPLELTKRLNDIFSACPPELLSERVAQVLDTLHFMPGAWADLLHFSEFEYSRILVSLSDTHSVVINCWNPKQATPIHTHATAPQGGAGKKGGINVWARALQGSLTLRCFDPTGAEQLSEDVLDANGPTRNLSAEDLKHHIAQNLTDDQCVSIHVYSPPYIECTYSRDGRRGSIPVVYCRSLLEAQKNASECLPPRITFSSFHVLITALMELMADAPCSSDGVADVARLLTDFELHPDEIAQYSRLDSARYTRRLIARHEHFSVNLLCWVPGQQTLIHDHGSVTRSISKVLRGEMRDQIFSRPPVGSKEMPYKLSDNIVGEGFVQTITPGQLHRSIAGGENSPVISLHVFSPPLCKCTVWSPSGSSSETCEPDELFE